MKCGGTTTLWKRRVRPEGFKRKTGLISKYEKVLLQNILWHAELHFMTVDRVERVDRVDSVGGVNMTGLKGSTRLAGLAGSTRSTVGRREWVDRVD